MSETKSQLTIAVAVDKPQRKIFTQDAKGVISSTSILPNNHWGSKTVRVNSLADLKKCISAHINMQNAAHFAVMRGEWLPDDVLLDMEKQRLEEIKGLADVPHHLTKEIIFKEGENPNLRKLRRGKLMREVPLHWVCFDFDGYEMEGVPFDVNNPSVAVDALIASELGQDFVGRSYLLQLSSSAGVPGKDGVRAHAWFWLKHGWTGAQWNAWYKQRKEALGRKPGFDKGMFQLERIHYIVDPVFKPEGLNPLLGKDRWSIVDGIIDDEVSLVPPEVVEDKTVVDYFNTDMVDEEEAQDAWTRPGVVGAFNRAYSMSETLQTFLSDKFEIVDNTGRVSWLEKPDAPGGLRIVAGNTKMFSTHNSDPRNGVVGNAFDIVETYMFDGDFGATAEWAKGLERVVLEMERCAGDDFDDIVEPGDEFTRKIDVEKVVEKVAVLTPEKVMELYPMPEKWRAGGRLQEAGYRKTSSGWRYGYWKVDEETERKTFIELWSPITIWNRDVAIQDNSISLHLRMMNHKGEALEVPINRGATITKSILGDLWNVGWDANNKNGELFIDFLREHGAAVKNTRLVSAKRGWFQMKGLDGELHRAFAAPSGIVYGKENLMTENIALRSDWVLNNTKKGSLEGWKNAVHSLCEIENVPHWIIGVASGLVGPLLELYDGSTPGIVFAGDTSRGKTTALAWAASSWGSPDERTPHSGLMRNLRSTANAVEVLAVGANSTLLVLDETNLIEARQLEPIVYTIAGGNGKQRLRQDGVARDSSSWSTFTLLSGEAGLAQRFEQGSGKKMGKGAAVRLLDFDVSGVNGKVPLEVIRSLKEAILNNHGWSGETFVDRLIREGYADDTKELWMMRRHHIERLAGKDSVGVTARAVEILAILCVAVELAIRWSILPTEFNARFEEAIQEIWRQILGGAVFNSHQEIMDQISMWVNAKWGRSVVDIKSDQGVRDVEAWFNDEFIFIPPGKLVEATGGIVREAEIRNALKDNKCLSSYPNGDKIRYTFSYIPDIGDVKNYRLFRNRFRSRAVDTEATTPEDIF